MKKQGFGKRAIALGMSSVLVCTTPVFAQDVTGQNTVDTGVKVMAEDSDALEESPLTDFKIDENGVLKKYLEISSTVVIPKGVTQIGSQAFQSNKSISTVVIPEGVTSIGSQAFNVCSNLVSVTLPKGLEIIGNRAFDNCSKLAEISFPEGIKTIGNSAFGGCDSLTSVSLPEGLMTIGEYAFDGCDNLASISLPEGVSAIGQSAFKGCKSLKKLEIPKTVQTIPETMCWGCSALIELQISEGVKVIDENAFRDCESLLRVTLPEGIETIPKMTFSGCKNLQEVELPSTLKIIGERAFSSCSMEKMFIPDGVQVIKEKAFLGCKSLKKIRIPESVTSLEKYIFATGQWTLTPYNVTIYGQENSDAQEYATENSIPFSTDPFNTNKITFDSQGGTEVETQVVEDGKTVTEPTAPTREGYTFAGWYLDDQPYDFSTEVQYNFTLTAKWTINTYTVTYDTDGGSEVASQQVVYQKTAKKPQSPTKTGYTFEGWYLGETAYDFATQVTGDVTLTAKWKAKTYTVTFNAAGGTKTDSQKVDYHTTVMEPTAPTKEGYTFEGWYLGDQKYDFTTPIEKNITLTAKWTKNTDVNVTTYYTVTFDTTEGSKIESQKVEEKTAATEPTAPTREGYTFEGWYLGDQKYDFATPVEKDITLTAKWTKTQEEEPEEVVDKEFEVEDGVLIKYNGSDASVEIPEGITRIEKKAFENNTIVEKISIPTGVTSIGEYAFYNCSNLRKISIPETVESIASNTFSGKKELLIYGVEGSYAESYASEKKIAFSTKTFPENENQILECAKTSYKVAKGDSSFNLNVEQTYGNGKVTYQSSDKNVVSVSSTGVVSIKGPGVAQITVKAAKTINYDEETLKVKVTVNPKESHITSKKVNARKWTLKWIKDSKVTGYQIQYSTDKKFKKGVKKVTLKKNSTTTWTSPKLTVGKTYYARVRSYKTVKVNGKSQNLYSTWCDTVSTGKVKKK